MYSGWWLIGPTKIGRGSDFAQKNGRGSDFGQKSGRGSDFAFFASKTYKCLKIALILPIEP